VETLQFVPGTATAADVATVAEPRWPMVVSMSNCLVAIDATSWLVGGVMAGSNLGGASHHGG